jgi:glycosyltransferase involved in cell wall biosynthesis
MSPKMVSNRKLRIALECRIEDPRSGVGSAILSLAHALSESPIEDQEYTFIVYEALRGWLEPHIFGPCRMAAIAKPTPSRLKRALKGIGFLRRALRSTRTKLGSPPASDGFVESGGFDLVHFTSPAAYLTSSPTIYQPWDLQHVHYPEFFTKSDFALREKLYRAFCEQARIVCVQTEWCKQDVARHFGIALGKIEVVRWGSVFGAYREPASEEIQAAREKFKLPGQFFFYPAVTWPHKNHEDIIRAVHLLNTKHGYRVDVFFTGASTDFRVQLDALARDLGVSERIHHLGFVTTQELQSIFGAATAMVFPSKFEGFGLPILEAFHARLPVLCSNSSVLPEVARDGALYFTPGCPEELAESMLRVLRDPELRQSMVEKGADVLSSFPAHDMARSFQDMYARVAWRATSGEAAEPASSDLVGSRPNRVAE